MGVAYDRAAGVLYSTLQTGGCFLGQCHSAQQKRK